MIHNLRLIMHSIT